MNQYDSVSVDLSTLSVVELFLSVELLCAPYCPVGGAAATPRAEAWKPKGPGDSLCLCASSVDPSQSTCVAYCVAHCVAHVDAFPTMQVQSSARNCKAFKARLNVEDGDGQAHAVGEAVILPHTWKHSLSNARQRFEAEARKQLTVKMDAVFQESLGMWVKDA